MPYTSVKLTRPGSSPSRMRRWYDCASFHALKSSIVGYRTIASTLVPSRTRPLDLRFTIFQPKMGAMAPSTDLVAKDLDIWFVLHAAYNHRRTSSLTCMARLPWMRPSGENDPKSYSLPVTGEVVRLWQTCHRPICAQHVAA